MAFSRYGLTSAPGDTSGKPQQYIVDAAGNWTMNCLACHQGKVAGQVVPGLPNSLFALQTLTDDVRSHQAAPGQAADAHGPRLDRRSPGHDQRHDQRRDVRRGADGQSRRRVERCRPASRPRWCTTTTTRRPGGTSRRRRGSTATASPPKGHRPLMQFMLIPENGPEKFHEWEADFTRDLRLARIARSRRRIRLRSIATLAATGRSGVQRALRRLPRHATAPTASYPNKIVPIDEVGTDPVRLEALSTEHRAGYGASWFDHFGERRRSTIRAATSRRRWTAFGRRPRTSTTARCPRCGTCCIPSERPNVWQRSEDGYDQREGRPGSRRRSDRMPDDVDDGHASVAATSTPRSSAKAPPDIRFPTRSSEDEKAGRARVSEDAVSERSKAIVTARHSRVGLYFARLCTTSTMPESGLLANSVGRSLLIRL